MQSLGSQAALCMAANEALRLPADLQLVAAEHRPPVGAGLRAPQDKAVRKTPAKVQSETVNVEMCEPEDIEVVVPMHPPVGVQARAMKGVKGSNVVGEIA